MSAPAVTGWPHLHRPGAVGSPVLLMLHGTGGDEQGVVALADALDPAAGVLAPRGRVQEQGMNRWFRRLAEGVFDVDDVVARAGELAGFLEAAREHYGLAGRPVVAVGFSNGANIGLATAALHPEALDRVVAFSGMYPFGDRDAGAERLTGTEVLLLNGRADPMAPLDSAIRLAQTLRRRGAQVDQRLREGGHGITAEELADARAWLAARA